MINYKFFAEYKKNSKTSETKKLTRTIRPQIQTPKNKKKMKVSVTLYNAPKKGEDEKLRQVIFRVRDEGNDIKVRSSLMADPSIWDESLPGYRATKKLPKGAMKAFNDKLAAIINHIQFNYTPMCDGKWLREVIDRFLRQTDEKPAKLEQLLCEDDEKDSTLDNLDEGSFPAWFMKYAAVADVCKGRKATYLSTIKKIRRYELYKREFEGQTGFNLYPDTYTIDDLYDFFDYVENEYIYYKDNFEWYHQFHIDKKPPVKYTLNYLTTVKSHIRAFMNWMTKNGYSTNMEYKKLHLKNDVYADPVYLTIEERDKVYYADLSKHQGLSVTRDMFIFQCMVGCRVSDLYSFTTRNLTEDGFIEYLPEKTRENAVEGAPSTFCRVPLNQKAREIIERHIDKRSGRLFPYLSKGMYSFGIKMLLLFCGIDRMVTARDPDTKEFGRFPLYWVATSHTARKTFIANVYKKVKDPSLICSMTGHVPGSKSFRRYRKIDDECKWDALEGIE